MPSLIGNKPNQVPTNGDLGTLAFEDHDNVLITGGAISGNIATTGLNFDSNTLVIDATNNRVGVGTASPSKKVTVEVADGDGIDIVQSGSSRLFLSTSFATLTSTIEATNYSLNIESAGTARGEILFSTSASSSTGTERMRITSAGNVGIGTSSPTQLLDVSGNAAVTGTGQLSLQRPTIPVSADQGSPQIQFKFYSTGTTYTAGAQITALTAGAWSSTSAPTNMIFSTVPSGSTTLTERMRLNSSGNLGLGGTNLPVTLLQVGGNDVYSGESSADNNVATFRKTGAQAGIRIISRSYNAASEANLDLANFASKNFGIRSGYRISGGVGSAAGTANEYLAFSSIALNSDQTITTTERMRIDSGGRLLVGATSAANAIIGIQSGSGFVMRSDHFGGGSSRVVTFNADFNYFVELTVTVWGNAGSGIHQGKFIAGRRDWTGSSHENSYTDQINTGVNISVSFVDNSPSTNFRSYTLTFTNGTDGANNHWMIESKLRNINSYNIA